LDTISVDRTLGPFAHICGTFCGRIHRFVVHASYIPSMTQTRERNEQLAEAMARVGLTSADLASVVEVDPRTIDRVVADRSRIPRRHARHVIAEAVQVPVGVLWPAASNGAQTTELEAIYASRAAMPTGLVMSLLSAAVTHIDVLTFAGMWLWDAVPGFGASLAAKAHGGVPVRVCLGDPDGAAVGVRGAEEGIDDLLAARCRLAARYAEQSLAGSPAVVRMHDTTLYATILRFDDQLLVNWHLFGAAAADSPVFQLRRSSSHGLAQRAIVSFERVWGRAHPSVG
jgi:lambda repressor-like predicted transcriptional regulator